MNSTPSSCSARAIISPPERVPPCHLFSPREKVHRMGSAGQFAGFQFERKVRYLGNRWLYSRCAPLRGVQTPTRCWSPCEVAQWWPRHANAAFAVGYPWARPDAWAGGSSSTVRALPNPNGSAYFSLTDLCQLWAQVAPHLWGIFRRMRNEGWKFHICKRCCSLRGSLRPSVADKGYYKWTDARGNPQHSDRPPPAGVEYEFVSTDTGLTRRGSSPRSPVLGREMPGKDPACPQGQPDNSPTYPRRQAATEKKKPTSASGGKTSPRCFL